MMGQRHPAAPTPAAIAFRLTACARRFFVFLLLGSARVHFKGSGMGGFLLKEIRG